MSVAPIDFGMRPKSDQIGQELYECFECGALVEDGGTCECGGDLRHIGRSRDL